MVTAARVAALAGATAAAASTTHVRNLRMASSRFGCSWARPSEPNTPEARGYSSTPEKVRRSSCLHGPQTLLGAAKLLEALLEHRQMLPLPLDHVRPGFVEKVVVPELLAAALEIVEQLVGLAGEPRPLLAEIDEAFEREKDLRAADHARGCHRGPHPVARQRQRLDPRQRPYLLRQSLDQVELIGRAAHRERHALARREPVLHAQIAHRDHQLLEKIDPPLGFGVEPRALRLGPRRRRQQLALVRQRLPDLLGDERHERMEQPE